MTAPPAIRLDGVTFSYEEMRMRFDLEVAAGEVVAIIGPSGSGKSTLLSLIGGFEEPTGGTIELMGHDVRALPPAARPCTTLFQDNNLFAHLDAATNVALGIRPSLALSPEDREQVETALTRVGLGGFGRRRPAELSGGERSRVALARALVRKRPILLLDEPFAALGPAQSAGMLDLLLALKAETGATVLLVTHRPEEAIRAATHTAFLADGRIIAKRETMALLEARDLPELDHYLGRSRQPAH